MSESDQVHLRRFPVAGGDDHDASGWIVVDARDVLCLTTWMGRLSLRLRNGESRFLRCDLETATQIWEGKEVFDHVAAGVKIERTRTQTIPDRA